MSLKAGTDHTSIPVTGSEMLHMLPRAIEAMDQPSGDGFNVYIVSYAARQAGLKVALSGTGGDELFAGYWTFRTVPTILRLRRFFDPLQKTVGHLLHASRPTLRRISRVLELLDAPADLLPCYLTMRRFFTCRQIHAIFPGLPVDGWNSHLPLDFYHLLESTVTGRAIEDAVGILDMRVYMGQTLLRDSDVMGMSHGLEIRIPFLDSEFSTCALLLDSSARQQRPRPKWRFVEAMGDDLPQDIVKRRKQGFRLPLAEWMLNELKEEVTEGIDALLSACGEMRRSTVVGLWDAFRDAPRRIGWNRPWMLFVLGSYLRKHGLHI
jgi:asparagine synthase (glutamine-hydrolysing)